MSTFLSTVLIVLALIVGGLIGYVIAVTQELLECEREMNDIQMRISEHMTEIDALNREIATLEKEIRED